MTSVTALPIRPPADSKGLQGLNTSEAVACRSGALGAPHWFSWKGAVQEADIQKDFFLVSHQSSCLKALQKKVGWRKNKYQWLHPHVLLLMRAVAMNPAKPTGNIPHWFEHGTKLSSRKHSLTPWQFKDWELSTCRERCDVSPSRRCWRSHS